jgi:hypothetical protein
MQRTTVVFLPTIRNNLFVPSSRIKQSRKPLKIGPRGCPEASVRNYHSTLGKIPKEGRFYFHPDGSLRSLRTTVSP